MSLSAPVRLRVEKTKIRLRVLPKLIPLDGKSVEMQTTDTYIQWRLVGDAAWTDLIALADLAGPKGDDGDPGPANSLSIGTVESGADAAATITGDAPSQTLNLTLPKGGDGNAATIAVGTVTTLDAGEDATVTNSGTPEDAVFDFGIPKGADAVGDMVAATYDPNAVGADAFDQDNMTDGTTNKNYTATEQSKLAGIASGAEVNVSPDWNASTGDGAILNKPTLGTAAATDTTDYATAAQGATADSAYQKSTILGTVSQSSGVPTGAIIERGSNANGSYVRYADGTQICTALVTLVYLTTAVAAATWTFPAAFSANPFVAGAVDSTTPQSSLRSGICVNPPSTSSVLLRLGSGSGAAWATTDTAPFYAIAIGTWF